MSWVFAFVLVVAVELILNSFNLRLSTFGRLFALGVSLAVGRVIGGLIFRRPKKVRNLLEQFFNMIVGVVSSIGVQTPNRQECISKLKSTEFGEKLLAIELLGLLGQAEEVDKLNRMTDDNEMIFFVNRSLANTEHESIRYLSEAFVNAKDSIHKLLILNTLISVNSPISYEAINLDYGIFINNSIVIEKITKYFVLNASSTQNNLQQLSDYAIDIAEKYSEYCSEVVDRLVELDIGFAVDHFTKAVSYKGSFKRKAAAMCLKLIQSEQANATLLTIIETKDETPPKVEGVSHVPEDFYREQYNELRLFVIDHFPIIECRNAVEVLSNIFAEDSIPIKLVAAKSLAKTKDPKAFDLVLTYWKSKPKKLKTAQYAELTKILGDFENSAALDPLSEIISAKGTKKQVISAAKLAASKITVGDTALAVDYKEVESQDDSERIKSLTLLLQNSTYPEKELMEDDDHYKNRVYKIGIKRAEFVWSLAQLHDFDKMEIFIELFYNDPYINKETVFQAIYTLYQDFIDQHLNNAIFE